MMNYVGSISILDRGDAPAQAVIDRNARSLAQRIADETKDELEKVMTRVETIYSSFEMSDHLYSGSNLEYLQDIGELEEIMKDQVKKKKYQQQVTIFVVGFSEVSSQKLRLMQQVNEFFMENSKKVDEEDWFPTTPDMDLEEVGEKIEDSLQVAQNLTKKLGELNKEMIDFMANYAEKKASNKLSQLVEGKGKKKMEKALLQAKEEAQGLAEKLLAAQTELEEREEKLQATFKQLETKNLEVQKFRTAAELAKKAVQDCEALQEEIAVRDAKILEQRQHINRMEVEVAQSNHLKERSQTKLSSMGEESQVEKSTTQQKIVLLQKELDEQKRTADDAKRDLAKLHDEQLVALREVHQQDMKEIKEQHASELKSLTGITSDTQSEAGRQFDLDSETDHDGVSRQSSKQESRPSTQKSGKSGTKKPGAKSPTRHAGKDGKGGSRTGGTKTDSDESDAEEEVFEDFRMEELEPRADKEYAEVGIQDEGGDHTSATVEEGSKGGTRHSRRSKSTLEPVQEFEDFEDAYDLSDEQSWASVPKDQLQGRFAQYRRMCHHRLREVEEQRQLTVAKTQRKVQLLKAQFVEHKNKWEAERKILIEQVEQAQKLQTDAEKEADAAMTQLEDFITEQEQLEEQEESRRSAILRTASGSSLTPGTQTPAPKTPQSPATPAPGTPGLPASANQPTPPESQATNNSEELQNLMQQTDDAKVEEMNARGRLTGTKSAPPMVDMTTMADDSSEGQAAAAEDSADGAKEPVRAKTAGAMLAGTAVPVFQGKQLLQLAAGDAPAMGVTIPVIYGDGKQVALFDITPGTITPMPTDPESNAQAATTSTFLTPEGNLIVTDPMTPAEGSKQGLVAVEVRASSGVALFQHSRAPSSMREGGSAGILRSGRPSPSGSPTRQVSFAAREGAASAPISHDGISSPRLSRLRRSRTAEGIAPSDLSVVMETTLPAAQESALESMRKMLMEENLAPKQQRTLDSVRSAMSKIRTEKSEERGRADGMSRLTNDEMLRTMTVITLASQLSHEALQLGVRPDSIFRTFGHMDTQTLFEMAPKPAAGDSYPHGPSRETTTDERNLLTSQTTDVENVDGQEDDTAKAVAMAELQDLPPIDGETTRDSTTPSVQPPPTAATVGSLPSHGQLETPLAEIGAGDATAYAKGDKQDGDTTGEPREDTSNLEKSRTNITEERQGTDVSEQATGKELSQGIDGPSDMTIDSIAASKEALPPSKTPDTIIKIDELEATTEEELRVASARSWASLRSVYKSRLEESRSAAEDRRAKSPVISLPTKLSVDDELVLDDDDDDDDIALPDDMKEELEEQRRKDVSLYEIGTSPPPGPGKDPSHHSVRYVSRKSTSLLDHPILREYLKTYDGVTSFKDNLSKMFLDKDMMSASQILADLETIVFDREKQVMPQVEQLTANVLYILEEVSSLINNAVIVDRDPVVSSLLPFSRDEMRSRLPLTGEASEDTYAAYTHPKMVSPASGPPVLDQVYVSGFQDDGFAGVGRGAAPDVGGVETTVADRGGAASVGGGGGSGSQAGSQAGSQHGSRKSSISGSTKQHLSELQSQCLTLQHQLEDESKKHEEQLRHNTVVMMEMQDTINELQRELSALGKAAKKPRSAASSIRDGTVKTPSPDTSLMFTRMDLERNAKIMKKAVMDQRLDADKYKDAVSTMDDYVSLPAQRLAHLVKKYVHHTRMKEIEENVKNSQHLDERVFDALDKMEALQNQRARQWAERMDSMGLERLRLAAMLMDSLDSIEQESGLFLIKPMYSFRGRELKAPPTQKLARPVRTQPVQRHQSAAHESTASFAPAPTPASNMRRMDRQTPVHQVPVDLVSMPPPPPSRPEDGVVGAHAIRNIITPQAPQLVQSHQTWNMAASHPRTPRDIAPHLLNTPRMLELDINRMLIGQNNISSVLPHPPTDDRLVNASNNSLRSYITVHRPTAALAGERPGSANGGRDTAAPPSSPSPRQPVAVSPTDRDLPMTMTSPTPLPPIGDRTTSPDDKEDSGEPPRSPPGSSMYQSTQRDAEESGLVKQITRTSSGMSNTSLSDYEQD